MTSDPSQPPSPSALQRLLQVLDRAGGRSATATELAELIWLAGYSGAPAQATQTGPGQPGHRAPASAPADSPEPTVPGADPEPPQAPGSPVPLLYESDPQLSDAGPRTSLLAPLPPMLAHPLQLQRALRPMRRRVPSHVERELDERSTAYRIARQGASPGSWLPVLRARPERWLTLHLLYDAGPTMPMWRPLLRELHRAIGQTGAFRGIQLLKLTPDGRLCQSPGGRPATLPPRDGRAVTLVLSDCSGPHWYAGNEGAAEWYRVLRSWARTTSLAIVQPLPERLWRRTALPVAAGLLTTRGPASPNSALRFDSFDTAGEAPAGLPLPVLEPSARWFAHWAELLAGPPGTQVPGVAAMLPTGPSTVPADLGRPVPRALSPQELVLNFRAHASPPALRLAAHLAVGEPSLPVMRLVQAATEARPEPQHLAEVVLSGLLTTAPGSPAAAGHYVFRPGVREVLLRSLPRSTAARVGAVIQRYAGSRAGEFPVTVPDEQSAEGGRAAGEPLAVVPEETVRNLSGAPAVPADELDTLVEGRYRLTRRRHDGTTSSTWRATDELLGREVALKLFDALRAGTASGRQPFLADAERLAALDIQGWARVIGYGMHDGRPYLVTDAIDGEDLGQLLQARGTLPLEMIREVGRRTARVLSELHNNGLLHLDLNPSALVLSRDGRVLVTDPGLGLGHERRIDQVRYPRPTGDLSGFLPPPRSSKELVANVAVVDHRSDLYSLGALLYAMATGAPPVVGAPASLPSGFPPDLEALVTDLLAIDPEDRPADAAEVLDRLRSPGAYDEELLRAHRAVRAVDPNGARMGRVLREAIDEVLNGEVTGRYDVKSLTKTEKTHLGSLVDMAVQREFRFEDGRAMDFRIADVDVDCRFSLVFGGWVFPRETLGHLCLLVWANDYQSRWSVGLLRVNEEWLNAGINRDLKATLKAEHRDKILWLWRDVELAENVLLHMSDADREAVFLHKAGQARLNEFFRRVQRRRIGRNAVRTVVQQRDYMKRIRGHGGSRSALRDKGIIILGDHEAHRHIARQLGLPVPREGEFVSARVVPVARGAGKPVAEMDGGLWSLASPEDPEHPAPMLPSHLPT